MNPTPLQGEARPATGRSRRLRRVGVAAGVAAALVGGGLTSVVAAPAANATTPTAAKTVKVSSPSASVHVSDRTYGKGARPLVVARLSLHGKPVAGSVAFHVSGRTVAHRPLVHGQASIRLSSRLGAGTHHVKVVFSPSSASVRGVSRTTSVRVYKYGSRVVERAVEYTGVRYVYGGSSPRGFDCSGFTRYVYKHATGKNLPRSSSAQRHVGHVVSKKHAKAGDLVYTPGHVGIYVGKGKMIDAPRPGKSIHVRSMWSARWTFIHVTNKATSI